MNSKNILVLLPLILTLAASAGIYRYDVPEERYKTLATKPQFDCVGKLYWKETRHGSCVFIGGKYVLCAAHCFMESLTRPDTLHQGKALIVVNKPYAEYVRDITRYFVYFNGKKYQSKTVHIYPGYLDHDMKHRDDIALIELSEPVTGITPAAICGTFDELHSDVVGVGYGVHGKANKPENIDTSCEKLAGENVIDSIGGYRLNNHPTVMFCDFDNGSKECNKMGSAIPRPLEYICGGGDSGGGLFRKTKTGWELIGICHGAGIDVGQMMKTGYYGQVMGWIRVSVFRNWIEENMK